MEERHELDFLLRTLLNNKKSAVGLVLSFKDRNDKTLHYARLVDMDFNEIIYEDSEIATLELIRAISSSILATYRDKASKKLKDEFNFY